MAEITAALVKELRDKTGAGMMDCKKALTETGGDMEAAVDWLRKKGLAAAAKKAGRVAAEGLVGVAVAAGNAAPWSRSTPRPTSSPATSSSRTSSREVAGLALGSGGDLEALKAAAYPGTGRTVAERADQLIATIGENMTLRRAARAVGRAGRRRQLYAQRQSAPGLGKIGVLVGLEVRRRRGQARRARQAARHARRRGQPAGAGRRRLDPAGASSARSAVLTEQARAFGQAGGDHREDGRGPAAQVLRGGRAARAGLRASTARAGSQGGREAAKDSARRSRWPASSASAGRGHREEGSRLRRRGRGRGRHAEPASATGSGGRLPDARGVVAGAG